MEGMTARQEWAAMWTLPLTAMIGVSGSGMFAYSSGIFMQSITGEFGWTRAQYSAVFMITMLQGLGIEASKFASSTAALEEIKRS